MLTSLFAKKRVVAQDQLPPQHVPHSFDCVPEEKERFFALWHEYYAKHGNPSDPMRVLHLMNLVQTANGLAEGDYIELGVHIGLTLRLIHKFMDPSRTLYGLDTFEGFDARDIKIEKTIYNNDWTVGNFNPTSIEGVNQYVGNPANLRLVKGWFPESFVGLEKKRWRFVHIDMDLYQPIKNAMALLWPNIVTGGVMLVHDYGCFGFRARIAVDEFAESIGIFPVQLADRWGSAVFRKPKPAV